MKCLAILLDLQSGNPRLISTHVFAQSTWTSLNTKTDNVLPAAKILSKSDIRILLLSCCCCCCYTFVSMLLGEKLDTEKYFSSFEHNNLTLKFKIVNGAIKTKAS